MNYQPELELHMYEYLRFDTRNDWELSQNDQLWPPGRDY